MYKRQFYRRAQTPAAFFVEGNDGRKYQLDPQSGIAKLADGEFERVALMNKVCIRDRVRDIEIGVRHRNTLAARTVRYSER